MTDIKKIPVAAPWGTLFSTQSLRLGSPPPRLKTVWKLGQDLIPVYEKCPAKLLVLSGSGMSIAFLGMVYYTLIKQSEGNAKAAQKALEQAEAPPPLKEGAEAS